MDGDGDKCFNYFFSVCAFVFVSPLPFYVLLLRLWPHRHSRWRWQICFLGKPGDLFCNRTVPF